MATINQLVRKPRKRKGDEERRSRTAGVSSAARSVHACLHHYP